MPKNTDKLGKLYGVSVGPGDPELLTLKAARILRDCDVVAAPNIGHGRQVALGAAAGLCEGRDVLSCPSPMLADRSSVVEAYAQTAKAICALLDEGKTVAYVVLGDATVYSTYMYVHELVASRGYPCEVIPGVTSFCAAAAALGTPLCQGPERLLVVPARDESLDECLDFKATKVIMKTGRETAALKQALEARGELSGASMAANVGLDDEHLYPSLADAPESDDYLSLVILRQTAR